MGAAWTLAPGSHLSTRSPVCRFVSRHHPVMLPECPAELSFLAPYLQRASELHDAQQPVMSYYCTLYAVSLALKSPARFKRSPETDVFLATLFTRLEQVRCVSR